MEQLHLLGAVKTDLDSPNDWSRYSSYTELDLLVIVAVVVPTIPSRSNPRISIDPW